MEQNPIQKYIQLPNDEEKVPTRYVNATNATERKMSGITSGNIIQNLNQNISTPKTETLPLLDEKIGFTNSILNMLQELPKTCETDLNTVDKNEKSIEKFLEEDKKKLLHEQFFTSFPKTSKEDGL